MLVRILTSRDGHPCGAEVDVPKEIAATWIGVGDAEPVKASKRRKGELETADEAGVVETR